MNSACKDNISALGGENFYGSRGFKYLLRKKMYPINNDNFIELLFTDSFSRKRVVEDRKKGLIKCFDCPHCDLSSSLVRFGSPAFYEYVANDIECNLGYSQIYLVPNIPNSRYDEYLLMTTKDHRPIEAVYSHATILMAVFEILQRNPRNTFMNDGTLTRDQHHCNMFLIPDTLQHLRTRQLDVISKITDTVTYGEFSVGSQLYFRLSVPKIKAVVDLVIVTRQVARYLYDTGVLENHVFTSAFFCDGESCVVVMSVTKPTLSSYQPNVPCFRVADVSKINFESLEQEVVKAQYSKPYSELIKSAMNFQVGRGVGLNGLIHELNTRYFNMPSKEQLMEMYKQVYKDKEIILTERFEKRHSERYFGWYKIIITLLTEYLKETDKLYKQIYEDEFSYSQKLLGNNMNYTILSGLPPMLTIEQGSEGHNELELMNLQKRIGEESAYGQVILLELQNKYTSSDGSAVVKMMTDPEELELEYENGVTLNPIRYNCPHFMYTFDRFFCDRDITVSAGPKGEDNLIALDFSKSRKPCFSSYPKCDPRLKKLGKCSKHVGFIFLELINNAITLGSLLKKIDIQNSKNTKECMSVLFQVALGLRLAQEKYEFVHNDMHTGNVLLIPNPSLPPNKDFVVVEYVLMDGTVYQVPIYGFIPVVIDFGLGRTTTTAQTNRNVFKTDAQQYFKDLHVYSDSSDILTIIKGIARKYRKKGVSDIGTWYSSMDIGKTYKEAPFHVNKKSHGNMKRILEDINAKMLELVPQSELDKAPLRYSWGNVEAPGFVE